MEYDYLILYLIRYGDLSKFLKIPIKTNQDWSFSLLTKVVISDWVIFLLDTSDEQVSHILTSVNLEQRYFFLCILSMHLWYTLLHLIQDALICLRYFHAFVIHSRASYTGCTDMPPFDPFRCPTLEATQIHVSASHSWGYSSRYTLVHLIQDALICLHLIHLGVPL